MNDDSGYDTDALYPPVFSGARFQAPPYTVDINSNMVDATTWCLEQFGDPWTSLGNPTGSWLNYGVKSGIFAYSMRFKFTKEADAIYFKLKWS